MVNSVLADTSKTKINKTAKSTSKEKIEQKREQEAAKEKEKSSERNENMTTGRGNGTEGRGSGTGRGVTPETKRKRSPAKENETFEERHARNISQLYPVWNEKTDLTEPTKFWKGLLKADQKSVTPFEIEELMGEGDSIHNLCRIASKKKPLKTGALHSVEYWIVLFEGAFNTKAVTYNNPEAPKLRSFASRLCKTDPRIIFEDYVWKDSLLTSRQDTIAWTAARKFLGDVWKGDAGFDIAKQAKDSMEIDQDPVEVTPKKVAFTTILKKTNRKDKAKEKETEKETTTETEKDKNTKNDGKANTAVNDFFLSKAIRKNPYANRLENTAYARKNTFFIKTKMPKVTCKDDAEAENEVLQAFNGMIQRLIHLDRRVVIFPWNDRKSVKPLTDGKELPKSRAQMELYVDRVYIQYNKSAYCRIKVGFDKEEDQFFGDNDWFTGKGYWYEKDALQVKIISNAGWFVGSIAVQETNVKDVAEAINQHPLIIQKGLQVEIRSHAVRIEQQEKIKQEDMVKALNVYGDYNRMATIRSVLMKIYKEGNKKGFPLGIKMRFVPNIADPRYPVTSGTKSNIKILRGKQKSFLKNIRKQKSHTIQGLDFYIEEVKATLRQVIMGMRSSEDEDKTLFISAEDDGGTRVTFTFHKRFEDEARHMVTVLPIMLQHLYGARVWSWFTEEAKAETSGWIYDEDLGRVVSPDENYTAEMLNDSDWDDDSIEEQEEEELTRPATFKMNPKIILDKPAKSNHYNDNGTVKTFSPLFKEAQASKPEDESLQGSPPSAVSTDVSDNTKAASSLTDGSPSDKMAMAKQFLAAMETDDELKKLFKAALGSASPPGDGVDG
jgi:hypothetical protein